jgi:hypothetical protein
MARRSKATAEKRRKEMARKEKQRAKFERRAQRKLGDDQPVSADASSETGELETSGPEAGVPDGSMEGSQ